jgi:hypothetical protein
MKTVNVTWTTQDEAVAGAETADHFVATLGTVEASEPLNSRSHSFINVEPGSYQGAISCVDANGKELAPPLVFSVTVPADATAPIPVGVSTQLQ